MALSQIKTGVRYPSHIITVDTDAAGEWRWQLRHVNRNIVDAATEGYKRRSVALRNLAISTGIVVSRKSLPRKGGFQARIGLYGLKPRVTV